jgi:hypothetical protein
MRDGWCRHQTDAEAPTPAGRRRVRRGSLKGVLTVVAARHAQGTRGREVAGSRGRGVAGVTPAGLRHYSATGHRRSAQPLSPASQPSRSAQPLCSPACASKVRQAHHEGALVLPRRRAPPRRLAARRQPRREARARLRQSQRVDGSQRRGAERVAGATALGDAAAAPLRRLLEAAAAAHAVAALLLCVASGSPGCIAPASAS